MHAHVVDPERAYLLVVDLQETYRDKLFEWERTVERAVVLIRAARLLELPVLFTEQYPRGLGPTAPEVTDALADAPRFEKRTLSALGAAGLPEYLATLDRSQAIVCGIETHACINHTVHDLLGRGVAVHLPCDALSSRREREHSLGLAKLLGSGAIGGSVEGIVLECLRSADHPQFKSVQALLK
jgi:nicotinamidase-related amidase